MSDPPPGLPTYPIDLELKLSAVEEAENSIFSVKNYSIKQNAASYWAHFNTHLNVRVSRVRKCTISTYYRICSIFKTCSNHNEEVLERD